MNYPAYTKYPAYIRNATKPILWSALADLNVLSFIELSPKDKKIGSSQSGHLGRLGRDYIKKCKTILKTQDIDPYDAPPYENRVGSLAFLMNCTKKTVRNRIRHYEKCGAILKKESCGKEGIKIWFHPHIIFNKQKGFEDFTEANERAWVTDQTDCYRFSPASDTTENNEGQSKKIFVLSDSCDNVENNKKTEKFTPFSSCLELINTNTASVNKFNNGNTKQLEGVLQESPIFETNEAAEVLEEPSVLPVPYGKGENPRTHPRTSPRTKQSSTKNARQSEAAPENRAPHKSFSERHTPKKDTSGGPGRAFLVQLVQDFWDYAKKRLYPGIILLEAEEKVIKNYIWHTFFFRFPLGISEESWRNYYLDLIKRVEIAKKWQERRPAFKMPDPDWYFGPTNTKGFGFYKTEEYLRQDQNEAIIRNIRNEINQYAKGFGPDKDKGPLKLFKKHHEYIKSFQDVALEKMFSKMANGGTLYQYLKRKQKSNGLPAIKHKKAWKPSIPEAFLNFKSKMDNMATIESPTGTILQLEGKHNLIFGEKFKRWSKSMSEGDFLHMLQKINTDYPCSVEVLERPSGRYFVTVKHRSGTTDKILATPVH